MLHPAPKTLILCAGLQSSGTTLVSYCFLQRFDTNGILDGENDLLPAIDASLANPIAWLKTTISCFRLHEIAAHYRDAGWDVRPLLVLRDLRAVWSSLAKKAYGRNGITAEDPPLRMRIRRFVDDWRASQNCGGVQLKYEDLIAQPAQTLQAACSRLGIAWDSAMLTWSKPPSAIAHCEWGNDSFWKSRGNDLRSTLERYNQCSANLRLSTSDLDWLESEFRDYNESNGYPIQLADVLCDDSQANGSPNYFATRRYEWESRRKPLRWLLSKLGIPNRKLIDNRSIKRAA